MDFAKVEVEVRSATGKGTARRARAKGHVPAVLYGLKEAPVALSLEARTLIRSLDKEKKRNTVFSLHISGGGNGADSVTAMIRDVQIHPVTQNLVHVDFLRVSLDQEVRVSVPLALKGHPVGVVNGGNLHQSVHSIPIAAKPAAIPVKIELDVSGLNIGQALHVSDLQLSEGVRALLDPKDGLASVVAPRAEKAEAETAAAAATPEGGAAPAEGAAAAGKDKDKDKEKEGGEKKGK